jgi:hypothetical protein
VTRGFSPASSMVGVRSGHALPARHAAPERERGFEESERDSEATRGIKMVPDLRLYGTRSSRLA